MKALQIVSTVVIGILVVILTIISFNIINQNKVLSEEIKNLRTEIEQSNKPGQFSLLTLQSKFLRIKNFKGEIIWFLKSSEYALVEYRGIDKIEVDAITKEVDLVIPAGVQGFLAKGVSPEGKALSAVPYTTLPITSQ